MKWYQEKLARKDVAPSLVSVFSRSDVGLVLISASGFHSSALEDVESALRDRTVILVELREIVTALERESSVSELLRSKISSAHLDKKPLTYPLDT
jgi:RNA-binding protein YhbY